MPAETDEDRLAFVDEAGFGVPVIWTPAGGEPVSVSGVLLSAEQEDFTHESGTIVKPSRLVLVASTVPGLTRGDGLVVEGRSFNAGPVMDDGEGMLTVRMEIAPE